MSTFILLLKVVGQINSLDDICRNCPNRLILCVKMRKKRNESDTLNKTYRYDEVVKIILWEEEIGRLAWDERRHLSYFTYNPDFIRKGLNISPLVAPVDGTRGLLPVWGEDAKIYQKLPAFVADSLPDAWGNQLFDLWRQQQKYPIQR